MTNLTPAQIEQFESTFRYFDKKETNTQLYTQCFRNGCRVGQLGYCLWGKTFCLRKVALIILRKDEDLDILYDQLLQEYGAITFEAFVNLLVCSSWAAVGRILKRWSQIWHHAGRHHRRPNVTWSAARGVTRSCKQQGMSWRTLLWSLLAKSLTQMMYYAHTGHSRMWRSWICA